MASGARHAAGPATGAGPGKIGTLARRWKELVELLTGGNQGIEKAVAQRYREDPALRARTGLDGKVFGYVRQVWAAAKPE